MKTNSDRGAVRCPRRLSPRRAAWVLLLVWPSVVWADGIEPLPASPRLARLLDEQPSERPELIDAFWEEMKRSGTPLVEPIEGEKDYVWLTFLFRDEDGLNNVVLAGGAAPGDPAENQLSRLRGTDIWYLTRRTRNDLRTTYYFSPNDPLQKLDWSDSKAIQERAKRLILDPLNRHREFNGSIVELAGAAPQPWIRPRPEVPKGQLQGEKFQSQVLGNQRTVAVYRPPGDRADAAPYPLLIVFDLEAYTLQVPTPTILNNLIYERRLPPVVALLVGNAPGARASELTCNDDFVRFLVEELLPWVRARHPVTSDPRQVVVAGSSAGGLAACYLALKHPEVVGNVLAQSASLGWSPEGVPSWAHPEVEGEWLTRQYAALPCNGTRFYLEAGLLETVRIETRHLRDVLQAKGYPVVGYSEYHGAHDYLNWRGSLADGLMALLASPE